MAITLHTYMRMDAINSETVETTEGNVRTKQSDESPQQIYNVDENGVPLDPKKLNVAAEAGSKSEIYGEEGTNHSCGLWKCKWSDFTPYAYL